MCRRELRQNRPKGRRRLCAVKLFCSAKQFAEAEFISAEHVQDRRVERPVGAEPKKKDTTFVVSFLVEEGGFEPPKRYAADLQSVPFGHSGTPPYELVGAGGRIRTPDLLITNQLLYRLSYTSESVLLSNSRLNYSKGPAQSQ